MKRFMFIAAIAAMMCSCTKEEVNTLNTISNTGEDVITLHFTPYEMT